MVFVKKVSILNLKYKQQTEQELKNERNSY